MTWICPDCTDDLESTKRHPDDWRFCPKTGRPKGVLHITPQELQRRWDTTMASIGRHGVPMRMFAMGVLHAWCREIEPDSYLGRSSGTAIVPDFPSGAARDAWECGTGEFHDLLCRTVEWKGFLVDLMMGQRGQHATDPRWRGGGRMLRQLTGSKTRP